MLTHSSKNLCLFHILDGLRQGLSSFSGPSRAAVIFAEKPMDLQKKRLLNLANALAKLDGALHLRGDLHLHGFACLLHSNAMPGEDRVVKTERTAFKGNRKISSCAGK
ncbi:MAG: hypothetical protein B6240_00040 [Desulfobacteraceae bacterium 4572_87]|nr:MAG: hypothetical protein B6240_00040 [Desulfobacteraceae bacterium 4572_87]